MLDGNKCYRRKEYRGGVTVAILKEVTGKLPLRRRIDLKEVRQPLLQIPEGSTFQGKAEVDLRVKKASVAELRECRGGQEKKTEE